MRFIHAWQWVIGTSPHTQQPKTQTRRLVKPNQVWRDGRVISMRSGHIVFAVGQTYAVNPAHDLPGIWLHPDGRNSQDFFATDPAFGPQWWHTLTQDAGTPYQKFLAAQGWYPARIRITAIKQEDVRKISKVDAQAEGFENASAFLDIWTQIHDPETNRLAIYLYGQFRQIAAILNSPAKLYNAWALTFELGFPHS